MKLTFYSYDEFDDKVYVAKQAIAFAERNCYLTIPASYNILNATQDRIFAVKFNENSITIFNGKPYSA